MRSRWLNLKSNFLSFHCRIGMEGTVYLAKGVKAPDNAALVSKAARIIEDFGGRIATVE